MEIVKFDLLSSKFNSSRPNNKSYLSLLRRHKKIGLFFNLVLCFLFILLGNSAHAARLPLIKSTKFDCNSLYSVSDGVGNPLGNTGTIFKIDLVSGQRTTMYSLNHLGSTIALGHKGGRNSGGPLVMYSWSYGGQGSRKLWTVESGATDNGETSTMFDFRGPAPFGYAGTNMAGGEVNQMTGEIYMTNLAGSNLNLANTGNFRLGIFNPVTGANRVGIPKPLTKGDTVQGTVGSDMAIDAEGNAYIIVQDNQHGPVHKVLIKVMPTTNSGYWPYVIVQHLRELPGSDVWGMAFVDGHLYTSHADYHIWRSNPLTGVSQRLHGYDSHNVVDLSSCQVAPIIKGKVYFDPVGVGNVDDFNGTVANIQVELWKDGSLITTHHTSEAGEFNFIVDSIDNQDYYVRIVRPEVNGIRAKQSWAAAKIATNSVTAYCGGSDRTKPTPMTESGPCVGANPYDPNSITSVDKSYIYSLVSMKTDDIVADASIALTTVSNYGDAPSSYHHATKPAQHLATGAKDKLDESVNLLRLGETVTVQSGPQPREDANAIASHDGVEVSEKKRENFISLQDAILIPGKAYTFRVKATGRNSQKAYLNAWVDWSQNQKEGKFGKTRFGLADMLTQRNDYVKFDYQVPSGSATGLHDTYARFRVSTTKGLGPNNDTLPDSTETIPWAVDGEVEDYRFYIATGEIKLSAISIGKLGKFNYEMSNVVEGYPSSKYDSIQTMSEGNPTYSSVAHAYASVGKPIVITQSFDDNLSNWTAVSAECYDENDKLITGTIFENGKLTIPGELVKEGGLSCQFNNSYGLSVELIKKISGERANKADQFTVQIKDGANVVASSTTTDSASTATTDQVMLKPGTYTLTEVMAAGSKSKLSRYRTSVDCENENAQSMTKLPLGNGNSFTLTPDYGDKITCTLTNTAILPDLTKSIIFANPLEIIANDGEEDGIATITVQLRDSSGQNITEGGDKIEIYFSDSVNHVGSIIDGTEAVDNGDGTYSIKVKSSLGGSDTFSYKVNGQESSNTVTLKYKPGKPDLTQSTITAVPATIFADNTEQSIITVQLKDRVGNDLTFGGKYVVTLVGKEPTIGQVNPSNYTMQNNGDGTFTAYVKSAVTGEDTFGFKIDSELATQESKVIYKAGVADPNTSDISVDRKEITADGSEVSTVTVTLKDSLGNLLLSSTDPKTNVAYNVVILPKNKPAVTDIDVVTNNNGDGTFTAKITSTKAGTDIFGFTIDGVQGKPEAQITYLPGLPDLKQSTITANPSSITADGSAKSDIIIQLKDKFGNDITAQSGKVMLTDVNIATQSSTSMEAEYVSGKYKYSLSSTKTGIDDKISFTLDGTKSENTTSLEYLPGSADLTQSTISVSPDTIVADGTEEATVTVQLRDAKGNKLTNSAGFVDLIFNDGNGRIGSIDSLTKIKDNGDGTYTATVKSTKAGSDKIGFMLNSITSTNTTNLVYKPGKVDLTVSTIVANPTTIEANNTEVSVITVQLKDRYGNNLETNEGQILVELNTNEMIGKVSNNGVFKYQGAGRYEIEVTSIKAGSDTFTYSLDGKGTGQQSVTVNYKTGGVSLTKSTITTQKNKIIADNSDETTIIVQLKDQFENNIKAPMGEQERVFLVNLDKGYPSLGVGQFELAYIGNGRYEANIKSKIAGIDNIGYKVGQSEGDALVGSNKVEVTYVPGPVDFEKSTIVAHPSSIIANGQTSSTVTVQLKDAFNNLITEDQGKISLVGLTLGELKNNTGYLVYQDGSYVGYVTSTKKGNDADIRFTLNNQGTSQQKTSITYTPDRVNLAKSTIVASKPEIIADYSDVSVITIQFKDSYGNNLDGEVEGVVSLVDLNQGEIKTALKSIGNGAYQAEIYSKVADADDIGFTLDGHRGGQGTTGVARVVYHPGEADLATSTIEAQPDVIVANNVTTAKIHVQLKDRFGNKLTTAPNDEIKIFITNTSGAIGSLTDFTNYNNGTYSALVKSSKTGKDLIDFSINGVASGKPTSVTYIAGSADATQSLISATPAIIVADDNSVSTVTVQLRDANGNNLTNSIGNAVSIGIVSNSPVNGTTISQVNDNNDGTYSITVKSKRTGVDLFGFYVLGVKSGNTTDVTYIPGNADLAHSTITAIPSTIVADGVEQTKITVQLKDKFNNNLDTDAGLVKLTNVLIAEAGNITLNYDGQQSGSYSGYLTSTKDGSDTISFELNGSAAINQSTTVVYKSGGVSLSRSTITATPDTIIADDTQTSEIIIQLKDQYGNDTYNNENVVLVGIEKGKLVTFGPVSDQKGKFKATIKSTKVGLDKIGFKVDNVESANNVAVTYRPGEPSLNRSTITVTPSEIIADNGMTKATVTVYLKDKFDNDLDSPINETVSLDSNSLVIGLSDSLTMSYAGDNVYKTAVYSKQVGTDTLKYKIGTNTGTNSALITYIPGPVSLTTSEITATPDEVIANGTDSSTIVVQLKDQNGNNLTTNLGTVSLFGLGDGVSIDLPMTYRGNGRYEGKIVSSKTGKHLIGYTISNIGDGTNKANVTFKPGPVSMTESVIISEPNTIVANGQATSTITIQLKDAKGNNLDTDQGKISLIGLNYGKIAQDMTYVGEGRYEGKITSTRANKDTIGFQLDNQQSNNTTTVTYTAGEVDLTKSVITADPTDILANNKDESLITVQLKDSYGNDIGIKAGEVMLEGLVIGKIKGNAGSIKLQYQGEGKYTGSIISNLSGTDNIGFNLDGETANGPETNVSINYHPGPVDIDVSTIDISPKKILADGKAQSTITIELKDKDGNHQAKNIGVIEILGIVTGIEPKDVKNVTYIGNGVYQTTVTSTNIGSDTISYRLTETATNKVHDSSQKVTIEYIAGAVDPSKSTIEIDKTSIKADGVEQAIVTVSLRDQYNHLIPGSSNEVMLILKGDGVGEFTPMTNTGNGIYQFTVNSTVTGTDNFEYRYFEGQGWLNGDGNVSVTYKPGAIDVTKSSIKVEPPAIISDNLDKATITITLRDSHNNLITTPNTQVKLDVSGDKIGETPVAITPNNDGIFKFTVTSTKPGKDIFSYQFNENDSWLSGQDNVEVEYLISDKFDQTASSIEAEPAQIVADGLQTSTITVKLFYESNPTQPLAGLGDRLEVVGKDGQVGKVKFVNETNGVYTFSVSSTSLGKDEFIFKTSKSTSQQSAAVGYIAGDAFDEAKSTITANPSQIVADGEDTSTITVELYYPNSDVPLAGLGDRLEVVGKDGQVGKVTFVDENNGVYTFKVTSTTLGKDEFIFKTSKSTSQQSAAVGYIAGDAFDEAKSTITATPSQIVADGADTSTITVELYYPNSDVPLAGLGDRLEVVGKDGQVGKVTFVDENNGVYTFKVTSTTLGKDEFIFKTSKSTSQQSAAVDYIAGDAFDEANSTITATPSQIVADGADTSTITVELYYPNSDVPLAGLGDRLEVVGKDGQVGKVTFVDENNGVYTFKVTSTTLGKDEFIFKTSKSTSQQSAAVGYIAGDAFDEAKSTITANPSQIVADGEDTSTITVELYYPNSDVPLAGLGDRLEVVGKDGQVGKVKFVNETNGVYTFSVSSTSLGKDEFIFKTSKSTSQQSAAVGYIAGDAFDEAKSTITANPSQIVADGEDTSTITVELYYPNSDVPLAGLGDRLEVVGKDGQVGKVTFVDENNGVYTFKVTSTTLGKDEFIFKTSKSTSQQSAAVGYIAGDAFDEAKSTITATPSQIVADGEDTSTITVELYYPNSDVPLAGLGDRLEVVGKDGQVGKVTFVDENNGVYTFKVTSTTLGKDEFIFKTSKSTSQQSAAVGYIAGDAFDEAKSTITANPSQIVADGADTSTITVELYYPNSDVPLAGLGDRLEVVGKDGQVGKVKFVNETNGVYTFSVSSTSLGKDEFIFKTSKSTSQQSAAVGYIAGDAFDEAKSTITANPSQIVADGEDTSTITVELYYPNSDVPLAGLGDRLEVVGKDGQVGKVTFVDENNGVYTFKVTSTTLGKDEFIFKTSKSTSQQSAAVDYIAGDAFDEANSTITATPSQIVADGEDTSTITVELYYPNSDVPLAGLGDRLEVVGKDGQVGKVTFVDENNGVYTFKVTSTTLGKDEFIFKTSKSTSQQSAAVGYIAGDAFDEAKSTITANPSQIVADGEDTSTITVELYYPNSDVPLAGLGDRLEVVGKDGQVGKVKFVNETNGVYTFSVSSTSLGKDEFIFKTSKSTSQQSAAVGYIAGDAFDEAKSTITANPSQIVADGADTSTITVELYYPNSDVPLAGLGDRLEVVGKDGQVGKVTFVDENNGVYTFKVTSTTLGKDEFIFKTSKSTSQQSAAVGYIAGDAFDEAKSTITATPSQIVADGEDTSTITVELYYPNSDVPLAGLGDRLEVVGKDGQVGKVTFVDENNGVYTFKVTSTTLGKDEFIFKTSKSTSQQSAAVGYIAGDAFDEAKSTITATPSQIVADGEDTSTITVELYYPNSDVPLAGLGDRLEVVGKDGQVGQVKFVNETNGVYTFSVSSTSLGKDEFIFKTSKSTSQQSAAVGYIAGDAFDEAKSTITANPSQIVADGADTSTITVELYYPNSDVPLAGLGDRLEVVGKDGQVGKVTFVDENNGVYTFKVTSTTLGKDEFIFKTSKSTSQQSAAVGYIAGDAFDEAKSTITANPSQIVADGEDTSTITVELYYPNSDVPLAGLGDRLEVVGKDGQVGKVTFVDENNGVYTFKVTSTTLGKDEFIFKTSKSTSQQSAAVDYIAGDAFDEANSTITATPSQIVADGADTSTITVELYYPNSDVPLAGLGDRLEVVGKDGQVGKVTFVDENNGVYTFKVTSTTLGKDEFIFKTSKSTSQQSAAVGYIAGDAFDEAKSTITANPSQIVADGEDTSTITVELYYPNSDVPLAGLGDRLEVVGKDGQVGKVKFVNETNGVYTFSVSSTSLGKDEFIFKTSKSTSQQSAAVGYIAGDAFDEANSTITANPSQIVADGEDTSTITVELYYPNSDVPLAGLGDRLEVVGKDGQVGKVTFVDENNGVYTFKVTSTTLGKDEFIFKTSKSTSQQSAAVGYIAGDAFDEAKSTITATPSQIVADGEDTSTITVELYYPNSDVPLAGLGDRLEVVGKDGQVGKVTFVDENNGVYTFKVTSTTLGKDEFIFKTSKSTSQQSAAVGYIAGDAFDEAKSTITANPSQIVADGEDTSTITVELYYPNSDVPLAGLGDRLEVVGKDGQVGKVKFVNETNGVYTFSVSSTSLGKDEFIFKTSKSTSQQSAAVGYIAGDAFDEAKSTITANPSQIVADGADTSTITVELYYPNSDVPLAGLGDRLEVVGKDGQVGKVTFVDENNGVYTFKVTSTTLGKDEFIFKTSKSTSQQSAAVGYIAGDAFDEAKSTITATPSQIVADGEDTSTITVELYYPNSDVPLAGLGDRLEVVGKDGQVGKVTFVDENNGVYTFKVTSTTLGKDEFIFKTSKSTSQQSAAVGYIAGDAFDEAKSTITATPSQIVADGEDTSTITVELYYPNSDVPLAGLGDRLEVVGKDGQVGKVTFVDENNGVYTFKVTSTTLGKDEFIFKTSKSTSQQSAAVDYIAGDAFDEANSTITATPSQIVADGADTSTITVELYYPNSDVPLAGLGDRLEVVGKDGQVGKVTFVDENNGVYTFKVTSTTLGKDEFIFKTSKSTSQQSAAVGYIAGDAFDEAKSTITANPSQIVADGEDTSTITVELYYPNSDVPLAGLGDRLEVVGKDGQVGKVKFVNETNGVYTFSVSSTSLGKDEFIFKTSKSTSQQSAAVGYIAGDAFDEAKSTITANPSQIVADGEDTSTITVELYYPNSDVPLAGLGDRLEVVGKDGQVGKVTFVDENNGVYTFKVTSTTLGKDEFIFKTSKSTSQQSAAVGYIAGDAFDEAKSTITATPSQIVADGEDTSTITVELYYPNSDVPLAGLGDRLEVVGKDGQVGKVTFVDENNGVYTFKVTSTTLGKDEFIFKTSKSTSQQSAAVGYIAGDAFDEAKSTITANPSQIVADGADTSTITVELYYPNSDVPLAGLGDRLEVVGKDGQVGKVKFVNETNGVYTFSVSSTSLGKDEFIFKTSKSTSQQSAAVGYIAGDAFDEAKSTITANPSQIVADGEDTSTITVELYYPNSDVPLAGLGDRLEVVGKDGQVGKVTFVDENNGVYTFKVTSTTLGKDEFIFKTSKSTSQQSAAVGYIAGDAFDEAKSTITATPSQIVADGEDTSTITVELYYPNSDVPLVGLGDRLEVVGKDGQVGKVTFVDENNGVYTFKVTSTTLGKDEFIFKTSKSTSQQSAAVGYIAGDAFDEAKSTITANPSQIVADGADTSTITVELYYPNSDVPLAGLGDRLEVVGKDGQVGKVKFVNETNGVYTFSVSSTSLGKDEFIFKTSKSTSQQSAAVGYIAGDAFDEAKSTITANPSQIVADGEDTSTITVELYYPNSDVPLAGLGDRLEVVGKDGQVGQVKFVNETNGVYTFSVSSTSLGKDEFIFKTSKSTSQQSAAVGYIAGDAFDEAKSTITANPSQIVADGEDTSTITVELFYPNSTQPLAGLGNRLELASKDGNALKGHVAFVNESNGVYTFKVTSTTLGKDEFIFKTSKSTSQQSATVSYMTGDEFDQTASTIEALPNSIRANGEDVAIVNVKLFYASNPNKPITGHTDVTLISKDPNKAIVGNVTPMGESATGIYSFKVTSDVVDSDEFAFKTTNTVSANSVVVNYVTSEDANLRITLKTSEKQVKVGDVIMFIADIENIGNTNAVNVSIVNTLPVGFSYIADSATITTADAISTTGNSPVDISNISIKSKSTATLRFLVRTGAGVKPGNNIAYAEGYAISNDVSTLAANALPVSSKRLISNRASVTVIVDNSDPMVDESLLLGTVYHDRNGNGMQDAGEPGIPGVKVISAEGLIMTTDQYGRYHLENVAGGKGTRGRNYILKVDTATLPVGTTFVTRNPLVRRITPGLPVRFDFAVKLPEEQVLEVSDKLFITGKADIQSSYNKVLSKMVDVIKSNDIKEVVIVTTAKQELATMRENILRDLLNAELGEGNSVIVGSQTPAVEGK